MILRCCRCHFSLLEQIRTMFRQLHANKLSAWPIRCQIISTGRHQIAKLRPENCWVGSLPAFCISPLFIVPRQLPLAQSSTHALITMRPETNEFLLLLLPLPSRHQIFVSEGKVFGALLLSGKSAMRLIVVLKRKIRQDYEANWLCAFVLFLLWHVW